MVEDGSLKVLKILSPRLGGDRRGRGQPAHRPAPDRDRRGPLSRDHRGQDRGPVRRRLPDRRGASPSAARRRSRRSTPMAAISASPSSWSTTRSTMPPTPRRWARASATISATARSPCRSSSLMPAARTRTGASGATRWPAASADDEDLAARDPAAAQLGRARRHDRARPPLRPARDRRARPLPRRPGQGGAGRSGRVRHRPRLLMALQCRR